MIVYVDLEHIRLKEHNPDQWQEHLSRTLEVKYKLENVSNDFCLVVPYEKLSPALLREFKAKAVLISGNRTEFRYYEEAKLAGLRAVFREAAQPTIGFCAGAQMMAETFGSQAAAINPAESGDMYNGTWTERTHECGFASVQPTADHPLLAGLSDGLVVMEMHYWEIKALPAGFQNLAKTDITPIQLIAHEDLPLYGTQFHPERWDEEHEDGRWLLENFFKLVDGV